MAEKRDYYEVLGVQKGASADEIKSAYKKAALKWHPDRHVNDSESEKKAAEEKFKEASEAYTILSDPDKKARYDQFGFSGVEGAAGGDPFSGAGFGNLNDILKDLFGQGFGGFSGFGGGFGGFGGGRSSSQTRVLRGRDIRTSVTLTLEEIASGCKKQVTIERNRPCSECGGKGTKNASDIKTCPSCKGSGQIQQTVNSLFGRTVTYNTCPQCGGEGKIVTNPCRSCSGTGLVRKRETVTVTIPAGVEAGNQLTVRGEGHAAPHNGVNGDLLVVIKETEHPELMREGSNLFFTKIISVTEAILGTEITVPCLEGPYKLKLEAGTQSGTVVKLRNRGLPEINSYGKSYGKGDFYVKILVWIPKKLSKSEREAIESMKGSDSFTPNPSREDKALFDKEKTLF